MQSSNESNEKQSTKPNAFILIKNVRDQCKQTGDKRVLMFVLATYCDRNGVCFSGNETLAEKLHVASRTVQRLLSQLAKDAEIDILQRGAGRNQRRYISLKRYLGTMTKGDELNEKTRHNSVVFKHDTCCRPNIQSEQPTPFSTPLKSWVGSRSRATPPNSVFEKGEVLKCSKAIKTILRFFDDQLRAKYPRFLTVEKLAAKTYDALSGVAEYPEQFREFCQYVASLIESKERSRTFYDGEGQPITIRVPKRGTMARLIYHNLEYWRWVNPDLFPPKHNNNRGLKLPSLPLPANEEAMYAALDEHAALLEAHGVDVDPDRDGDFFNDLASNDWRLPNGERVRNWMLVYIERRKKIMND